MGNKAISDNNILREGLGDLERRLPPSWRLAPPVQGSRTADAEVVLTAPDGRTATLVLEVRSRLDPRGALVLGEMVRERAQGSHVVVVARYLSDATRRRLRDRGLDYLDLTGNVRIAIAEPGLYLETQGAAQDPDRRERPARSLRGAKAGRIVRALVDLAQPPGVRELASLTGTDPGYVSRLLSFLDAQALVSRDQRGRPQTVDWPELLRRWATDAPLDSRARAETYLEPRGLPAFLERLGGSVEEYAVTASLAAASLAPIAPPRLATVWIRDADAAASRLELRPAQAGANVLLLEPSDDGVFVGATPRDGIRHAAPSQIVADLLSGPGREPAEAEGLLDWMHSHEEEWRRFGGHDPLVS